MSPCSRTRRSGDVECPSAGSWSGLIRWTGLFPALENSKCPGDCTQDKESTGCSSVYLWGFSFMVFDCPGPGKVLEEESQVPAEYETMCLMLRRCHGNGTDARFVLFDDCFANDGLVSRIGEIGCGVICRLKAAKSLLHLPG